MATIWIHRVSSADILVDFSSIVTAYDFAMKVVYGRGRDDYVVQTTLSEVFKNRLSVNSMPIAVNPLMQCMMIPFGAKPDPSWSETGFVKVTAEQALALGEEGEPEGFVPCESDQVWTRETRTAEELDEELNAYMSEWRDITAAAGLKLGALQLS